MARKADAFYYENLIEVAQICGKAADFLVECLTNFDISKLNENLMKMHEFEHAADEKKHEMGKVLSKAFITPLEREDLAELSFHLDEVSDNIEEVLRRLYMYDIKKTTKDSVLLAQKVAECCKAMEQMFLELHNFKKPEKLLSTSIRINDIEEECDRIYLESYRTVRAEFSDALEIIAWRKIYDYLERCSDSCEHVADIVDKIVMKNT